MMERLAAKHEARRGMYWDVKLVVREFVRDCRKGNFGRPGVLVRDRAPSVVSVPMRSARERGLYDLRLFAYNNANFTIEFTLI